MSVNPQVNTLEREPAERIKKLERKVSQIMSNLTHFFIVPKLATDPTNPVDGQMWFNTTSKTFKCRINSATKTITVA